MRERKELLTDPTCDAGERRMDALIALCFGAVMLCIVVVVVFFYDSTGFINKGYKDGFLLDMLPLGAIVFAVLAAIVLLIRRRQRMHPLRDGARLSPVQLALAFSGLLVLQLFVGYNIYSLQSGDMYWVLQSAFSLARGETQYVYYEYFEAYPNNIPVAALFSSILRLWMRTGAEPGMERFVALLMALQCVAGALAGTVYMVLAARLTGRRSAAYAVLAGYTGLIALSGWMTVPYSDPVVLTVPALTAYFDLRSRESSGWGGRIAFAALAGAVGGLGMMIKPQSTMVLCAILFCEALGWLFSVARRNRASLLRFGAVLCAFMVMYGPVRGMICDASGLNAHSEGRVSMLHYLYMGLGENMNGGYNAEDYVSLEDAPTYAERQALYIEGIRERIGKMGPWRLLVHAQRKCLVNFSDGTFAWGINGHEHSAPKNDIASPLLRSIFWEDGPYNPLLSVIQQGLWLAVLMLCPFAGSAVRRQRCLGRRASADGLNVLLVSALGFAAFSTLFESGGRYIFCMAPVFILLAACALLGQDTKKGEGCA